MSEYNRTTRECTVSQLHPELLHAIQNYFQEKKLGHLESETQMCCETISERKSANKLLSWLNGKSDTTIYTGILLTSDRLIWVHYGDQSGTLLNAANLQLIQAELYTAPFTKETGLQITGFIEGTKNGIRGQIEMGPEMATEKFCERVKQAIAKLNPPPAQKRLFGFPFGGGGKTG